MWLVSGKRMEISHCCRTSFYFWSHPAALSGDFPGLRNNFVFEYNTTQLNVTQHHIMQYIENNTVSFVCQTRKSSAFVFPSACQAQIRLPFPSTAPQGTQFHASGYMDQ